MEEARVELGRIIEATHFRQPACPVIQCVDARAHTDPGEIKNNLIEHITHPVLWTDMVNNMVALGVTDFYETGTDDTLQKIVSRMFPSLKVFSLLHIPSYKGRVRDYSINN
jgi:[acyl-carrier-protein] S-malonyltransferase